MKQMAIVNNANVHRVTKGSDMTEQLNNNSRLEEIRIMFLYFLWRYYQDTLLVKLKKNRKQAVQRYRYYDTFCATNVFLYILCI